MTRACCWCARDFPIIHRRGRPRQLVTLRSLLDDSNEHRIPPTNALNWIRTNSP